MITEPIIFKLQRPVFTTGNPNVLYCYNEDRSFEGQFEADPALIQELFGDSHKIFVEGTVDQAGQININAKYDETAFGW